MINNFDQFKLYVNVPASFNSEFDTTILPVLPDAIYKVRPFLGSALCDELTEQSNTDFSDENVALIPYVRRALARFMLHLASPSLDLQISPTGYQTRESDNFAIASANRVKKFDDSLESLAWDAVELMLKFLEDNKVDYPLWVDSDAYTMHVRNLVNSAVEFDGIVRINASRLKFTELRPEMDRADLLYIRPEISDDIFDDIIEKLASGETPYPKILKNLKSAEVFFAAGEMIDKKYTGLANQMLGLVKRELDANPDTYPLYRDSAVFRGETPEYDNYVNNEESGFFISG